MVNATNATIVSPPQETVRFPSHITSQMPQHSYRRSEVVPPRNAAALQSSRGRRQNRALVAGSTTLSPQGRGEEQDADLGGETVLPGVLSPAQALKLSRDRLSDFEKGEILDYQHIYFMGNATNKGRYQTAFDDEKGYYNVVLKDHIAYRYEVLDCIGKGSFGQALKCYDHKEKRCVALKLIRSKKKLYHQATVEVKILKHIRDHDPEQKSSVVRMLDYFMFRKHIVSSPRDV